MKNYAITRTFVKMYEQNETLSTQEQSDVMEKLFPQEVARIMDENFLHDVPDLLQTEQFLSVTHEGLMTYVEGVNMSRDEQDAADLEPRDRSQDEVSRTVTGANKLTLLTTLSLSQHCHWS